LSLESRKSTIDDPGHELVDQVTSFWDRYGRIVLVAVVAIAAIAAASYFVLQSKARQDNTASEKLAEANTLFWQGDYARSKTAAQEVSKQYGGTPSGIDALRIAGDDAYWTGDWKSAVTDYREYLKRNGSGPVADAVRRSLGYALESDKQYAEAAKLFDQLVGTFDRESSAEFLASSARCYMALSKPAEAKTRLQRLVDEFGESSYAVPARLTLGTIEPPKD